MVWIHGGANVHGRGDTFDGEVLATSQDVIVVTINYRLGVFGWFRHAALRAETSVAAEQSGNYAVLDMLAALAWVRDNIAGFGGDPANVTVFGESAGGTNVFALLVSPLAKGLFQRAIVQSGTTATMAIEDAENCSDDAIPGNAQSSGELLLRLLIDDGLAENRMAAKQEAAAMDAPAIAHYLRGKSFAELDAAYGRIADRAALQTFPQLFRDGAVLSALDMDDALRDAAAHPCVPVMIGSTRDEFSLLLPFISGSLLVESGPAGTVIRDRQRYALVAEYLSLLLKAQAVDRPAEMFSDQRRQPVFVYRFDWDELAPVFWLDDIPAGATHGLDVPFVFGHARLGAEFFQLRLLDAHNPRFHELSRRMMSYWAEFARSGDPGSGRDGELPRWLPWQAQAGNRRSMLLDAIARGGVRLCDEHLTTATVLEHLQRDVRLHDAGDRYRLLCDLQRTGASFGLFGRENVDALLERLRQDCASKG
jgi:para-nitrobenzyl esterase